MNNPRIFFDVEGPALSDPAARERWGRIVVELFAAEVPTTAENVRSLATGERGASKLSGAPLHYVLVDLKGSKSTTGKPWRGSCSGKPIGLL